MHATVVALMPTLSSHLVNIEPAEEGGRPIVKDVSVHAPLSLEERRHCSRDTQVTV